MNIDEFEQELRRQPMRPIPAEWRGQVLDSVPDPESPGSGRAWGFSWRELLWPSPHAWAGLAAAWAVILALNSASGDSTIIRAQRARPAQPSPQFLMSLQEQWQLRAELMDIPVAEAAPRTERARPRSETSHANRNA